jgi:hypothetical protein
MLCSLILLLLTGPPDKAKADSCTAMIPESLRASVMRAYPSYDLPKQADNVPEDVAYNRKHGGNGCLGAVRGDFDGDGRKDFALLLTSAEHVRFVVAFARGRSWGIEEPWEPLPVEGRSRMYVATEPPGKYEDLGLSDTRERGEVDSFTSKTDVPATGRTESTEIVFWKSPSGWVHLWISD